MKNTKLTSVNVNKNNHKEFKILSDIMINDKLLLDSLNKFYENEHNKNELLSIITNKKNVSLRSIDWFITNYSKMKTVS